MNSMRKVNRPLMPHNENLPPPEITEKLNLNRYAQFPAQPYSNHPRDANENQNFNLRRSKNDEQIATLSISQLNLELDKNISQIISLINRRKSLIAVKKKKILEEANQKLNQIRASPQNNWLNIVHDQDFLKITGFSHNPHIAVKMLGKVIQTVPEIKGPRIDEDERSEQFWTRNRKLQNDIDTILEKLKTIDKQLEKQNGEVIDICRDLDRIEDTLKSFVGTKTPEHVAKVEPLFNSKKKNYDILNRKIKEREISKDKKIDYIKRIRNILEELKRIREERLLEIAQFFGIDNTWQFDKMNLKDQSDFGTSLEELIKIREREKQLEISEKEIFDEMQVMQNDQDKIYNELLNRFSDQAKSFHNFASVQTERIRNASILGLFQNQTNNFSFRNIDTKEYLKKFKEVKNYFKRYLEEDTLLKQGLLKTSETTKTFVSLLRSTQNEKERRHELLTLLETCIRKRGEYEQKRDEMRTIQFEESRNQQQLTQFQEDLEAVLTDGDLQGYKKIGTALGKCSQQKTRLNQLRQLLEKQMESMDREVVSIANRIQDEYQDILSDILPSDYEYSLKTGQDVKRLRNQLRRMYKRLGLLNSE